MDQNTIQMMKLFQENVKKDITNTNSVIKLVQEKLKDCDINLNFLKQISKELNIDFANLESKLNLLESNHNSLEISRENSFQNLADTLHEICLNETLKINIPGNGNEMEDLENSYINVTINQDGTLIDETNWAKRSSISSTCSTNTISSDDCSNDADYGTTPTHVIDNYAQMNNNLIRMLLQNSKLPNGN